MIELWGRTSSINVRKVLWTLQELGLPFERIDAGLSWGVVDTPQYARRNPNRLVPLLRDGDFELWESNAIVRYLCARYAAPDTLYPAALAARFDAERWMDWQQTTLNVAGRGAFIQLIRTAPAERRQHEIDASRQAMAPLLDMLDRHLAQRRWMGGAHFGMADIPVACDIHRWFNLPQAQPAPAHLRRWYGQVLARPATRGVLDLPLA